MRVGGRLSHAAMPDDCKQPAIWPKESHITKLALRHIHDVNVFAGRNHVSSTAPKILDFWSKQPSEKSCPNASPVKGNTKMLASSSWQIYQNAGS